jgi:hypothetical protein
MTETSSCRRKLRCREPALHHREHHPRHPARQEGEEERRTPDAGRDAARGHPARELARARERIGRTSGEPEDAEGVEVERVRELDDVPRPIKSASARLVGREPKPGSIDADDAHLRGRRGGRQEPRFEPAPRMPVKVQDRPAHFSAGLRVAEDAPVREREREGERRIHGDELLGLFPYRARVEPALGRTARES